MSPTGLSTLSEATPEGSLGCLLDRIEIAARPIVWIRGQQRRLRQESGPLPFVRLRGVHQERVTQVHCARIASGGDDRAVRASSEAISGQLPQRQPLLAGWCQLPGDVLMIARKTV